MGNGLFFIVKQAQVQRGVAWGGDPLWTAAPDLGDAGGEGPLTCAWGAGERGREELSFVLGQGRGPWGGDGGGDGGRDRIELEVLSGVLITTRHATLLIAKATQRVGDVKGDGVFIACVTCEVTRPSGDHLGAGEELSR